MGGEEPPGEPGEPTFPGGDVEVGVVAGVVGLGGVEAGELGDGTGDEAAEVDEDASLLIVNSGLALPESPNTRANIKYDAS